MNALQQEIADVKTLRRDTDALIQRVKAMPPTRERALAITQFEMGGMWLGKDLQRIGEAYPHSKDPSSPVIDPPADVTL